MTEAYLNSQQIYVYMLMCNSKKYHHTWNINSAWFLSEKHKYTFREIFWEISVILNGSAINI